MLFIPRHLISWYTKTKENKIEFDLNILYGLISNLFIIEGKVFILTFCQQVCNPRSFVTIVFIKHRVTIVFIKDYRDHDFPNTEFSYFLTIDTRQ